MTIPMRIFGDHDERVVAQLERCAAAGPATRAVLCADGHLGYSQPIGGAIAYERAISPSAVGYSTVHGAGRAMSRTRAAGKWRKRDGRRVREGGAIDFDEVSRELRAAGIELRGGAADEAPAAYKRLAQVLAEHGDQTIRVIHTLTPLGVAMAGADTFDPFTD